VSRPGPVAPPARRKRVYNLRKIRATWPYTAQEIADLFGVHKNAVLRPYLIRGDELIRFLSARQSRHRHKCSPTQFYCFKCRCVREPYLGIVDIVIENSRSLRLSALCSVCGTSLNKLQRVADLPEIHPRFHVQKIQGEHLIERAVPGLDSDLKRHG
jgi:hypothetical protein